MGQLILCQQLQGDSQQIHISKKQYTRKKLIEHSFWSVRIGLKKCSSWTTYHCSVGSRSKVLLCLIVHPIQHILYSEGVPDRLALGIPLHILLLLALHFLLLFASTLVLQSEEEGRGEKGVPTSDPV